MKTKKEFDYANDTGPKDEHHLKCNRCGLERKVDPDIPYRLQSDCQNEDGGQMMGWDWNGWKDNPQRRARERKRKQEAAHAMQEPVPQESEPFENFTLAERNIQGLLTVNKPGEEAPWLTPFGVALIKIYGMRRHEGKVEFGIGNEELPILGWVEAKDFYHEWPT